MMESRTAEGGAFGLPSHLDRRTADTLLRDLTLLWQALFGATGPLGEDLERLRRWFDPVAQGERLRREIAILPAPPPLQGRVLEPLVVAVGEGRMLITPEGRCALELLHRKLEVAPAEVPVAGTGTPLDSESAPGSASPGIALSDATDLERILLDVYRVWSRHRLDGVVRLLHGLDKPLQVPAAGLVLALLVNRSTAPNRAMIRYKSPARRQQVDQAFFGPVRAFTLRLAPKTRADPTKWRLVSGWMAGEARRRLSDAVVLERPSRDSDERLFIQEDRVGQVLDTVVRDLRRGHRAPVDQELLAQAFDDLVEAYRASVPPLAAHGLVHERPGDTARLRADLLARFPRDHLT